MKKDKFLQILDSVRGQTRKVSRWKRKHLFIENNAAEMYTTVSDLWCVFLRDEKNYTAKFKNFLIFMTDNCELAV
jgi:hypothetical protein